jgi:Domain of unknown function (DUF4282)/zinc-ribbon domain
MTFCTRCGSALPEGAMACPNCGQPRGSAAGYAAPVNVPPPPPFPPGGHVEATGALPASDAGFLGALFDFSFTSFITTKLIKFLYALGIIMAGFLALMVLIAGFTRGPIFGVLGLIAAAIYFFVIIVYSRVVLELIIVIFRAAEHLTELVEQGRRRL